MLLEEQPKIAPLRVPAVAIQFQHQADVAALVVERQIRPAPCPKKGSRQRASGEHLAADRTGQPGQHRGYNQPTGGLRALAQQVVQHRAEVVLGAAVAAVTERVADVQPGDVVAE